MFKRLGGLVLVGVLAVGLGCNGTRGGAHSSVEDDKVLGMLTPDELLRLCEDIRPTADDAVCDFAGLEAAVLLANDGSFSDADLQSTCAREAADCRDRGGATTCANVSPFSSACTVTVGDYLTCVNDTLAMLPPCNILTNASLRDLVAVMDPPSCTYVDANCPR